MSSGTAMVIGMGTGMGYGVAKAFCKAGFHVHLVSRTAATLEGFAKHLTGEGFSADWTALDAHDVGAMTTCINAVGEARGGIDVLVHNPADSTDAGFAVYNPNKKSVANYSLHKLRGIFELYLVGPLGAVQAALPWLTKKGTPSTVIFSGGGGGNEPAPGGFGRNMCKAALKNFSWSLSKELHPANVHVCNVTLAGSIARGNSVDPDDVGEAYLAIHQEPAGSWNREWTYRGKGHIEKGAYPADPMQRDGPGYVNQPKTAYHDRDAILKQIGAAKL